MPGKPEFSRAAFDRGNDLVGDVLVNVEAFAFHGGPPCLAGRAIAASWGQGDRDHGDERSNAAPAIFQKGGAPQGGAELHKRSAEASRVDREAGPVNVPT